MKKIILIFLLMFPMIVKAGCSNSEMTRYKTLSGHIISSYEYNESNNTFTAILENVHSDLYAKDDSTGQEYRTNGQGISEIQIWNLEPGKSKTIKIYATNGECKNIIMTQYLNPPYYNKYYTDPVCNNNDNVLCSKWANTTSLSYEKFVETVNRTTEEPIKEEHQREEEKKQYSFLEFLADYYILILLMIIVFGSFSIYKIDKKNKFDF